MFAFFLQVSDEGSLVRPLLLVLFILLLLAVGILFRRRAKETGQPLKFTTGLGSLLLVSAVILLLVWLNRPTEHLPSNEASAVGILFTVNTAALQYLQAYHGGYPPSLAELAPAAAGSVANCRAAGLIDSVLAAGEKSGYRFEYRGGAPQKIQTPDCPAGVDSYAITARPLKFGKTASSNYYTDQTRVIRFTRQDRPATAEDPPAPN